jgi:hypothetical protein
MDIYTNCHLGQESLYSIPGTLLHPSNPSPVGNDVYSPGFMRYRLVFIRRGEYPRLYRRIRARCVSALRCYSPPGLVGSHKSSFQYLCTYRGLRYAADGKVASASQDRLRHDPIVQYIFGTRDETASLLNDYDARLTTQNVKTLDDGVAFLVLRNADIPRP